MHTMLHSKIIAAASLAALAVFFAGCSANMEKYYSDITAKMQSGSYKEAILEVENSKDKYGEKNILLFYLDSGILNHYAENFAASRASFEFAKSIFDDFYTKSVSAGAFSMLYNDASMPYYGENFERSYITFFQSLNYILDSQNNESAVEARQADTLFKFFISQKSFYQSDAFIEYFMGLVYENAGYLNDASISYYAALKSYSGTNNLSGIAVNDDIVDDAYTSSLKLGFHSRAAEIKKQYPGAKRKEIPKNCGELIIVDYNGIIPKKTETVFRLAMNDAWLYMNAANVDSVEMTDYQRASSIGVSAFANDFVQFSIPSYKNQPPIVYSFTAESGSSKRQSYTAQDLGQLAKTFFDKNFAKLFAKTAARAVIKFVLSKQTSAYLEKQYGATAGLLAKIATNVYTASTEIADLRAWRTLPSNILMARMYLPSGLNEISIKYFDRNFRQIKSETLTVNITEGKKNFAIVKTPY